MKVLHNGNIVVCKFLHDSIIDLGYCYIKMVNSGHGNTMGKFHITCIHPASDLELQEPSVTVDPPPTTVIDPSISTVSVEQTNETMITDTRIETTGVTGNESLIDIDDEMPGTPPAQPNRSVRDRARPQYFSESTHSTRGIVTNDFFSTESSDDDSETPSGDIDEVDYDDHDQMLERFGRGDENYSKMTKAEWDIRPLIKVTFYCPLCLNSFTDHDTKDLTKCNHHICMGCSLEAIEKLSECPYCKKRMVDYYQ